MNASVNSRATKTKRVSTVATRVERKETFGSLMKTLGENFSGTKGLLFALVAVNWLTFTLAPGTVGDTYWQWIVNL